MATVDNVEARLQVVDADDRTGPAELNVPAGTVTVDADFLAAVDVLAALTGASGGSATNFVTGAMESVQLVVTIVPAALPVTDNSDIRNKWRITWPSGAQRTIPGRGTLGALTDAADNGTAVNKANSTVTAFFAALTATPPAGLGILDPVDDTNVALTNLEVNATTRSRKIK